MDVVTLLHSKNRCLRKFLELSVQFENATGPGDLSGLALFQARREATLKGLELYDRKITEVVAELRDTDRTPALVEAVRNALELKETLVREILAVDLKIIARIENAKNELMREMSKSRKSQEVLGKFKSSWVPESGEGLDEKL